MSMVGSTWNVAGPLMSCQFAAGAGNLCGIRDVKPRSGTCSSLLTSPKAGGTFPAARFGELTACLKFEGVEEEEEEEEEEVEEVEAALLQLALLRKVLDVAVSPRPSCSTSDCRKPTVFPDKRYKNTVAPDCRKRRSCNVSVGFGTFLPTIHFCT